jgi:glycosyltransferase involved in cell wall biosynthesis
MGFYFSPRGGSAHACQAIAMELERQGFDVTLLAGSRTDTGIRGSADSFFDGRDVRAIDFTPALESASPMKFKGGPETAPMHASYEDRPDADDPVFATLGEKALERQVEAWSAELERAGAAEADLLYLHHLTPINEAAKRVAPDVPIIGHVHGSELLMLEQMIKDTPAGWHHAESWARHLSEWAASCARIIVNSTKGLHRASELLDIDPERFLFLPNGVGDAFAPRQIDRVEHWRQHLVEEPQGWAPNEEPGSVSYDEPDLEVLRGTTLLNVGRFTDVKRIPLLIEAFANARDRFQGPTALVLLGGHPGEWEGEHPLDAIARTGAENVFLAGWHEHEPLPDFFNASDVLVHSSANEQFGQVLIEAMASGLPVIAVERGGPAHIVDHGKTGWLIEPDDRDALEDAMVEAVNDPARRERMGEAARTEALEEYGWSKIGDELARLVVHEAGRPEREAEQQLLP